MKRIFVFMSLITVTGSIVYLSRTMEEKEFDPPMEYSVYTSSKIERAKVEALEADLKTAKNIHEKAFILIKHLPTEIQEHIINLGIFDPMLAPQFEPKSFITGIMNYVTNTKSTLITGEKLQDFIVTVLYSIPQLFRSVAQRRLYLKQFMNSIFTQYGKQINIPYFYLIKYLYASPDKDTILEAFQKYYPEQEKTAKNLIVINPTFQKIKKLALLGLFLQNKLTQQQYKDILELEKSIGVLQYRW